MNEGRNEWKKEIIYSWHSHCKRTQLEMKNVSQVVNIKKITKLLNYYAAT